MRTAAIIRSRGLFGKDTAVGRSVYRWHQWRRITPGRSENACSFATTTGEITN